MKIEIVNKIPEEVKEKVEKDWEREDTSLGVEYKLSEFSLPIRDKDDKTVIGLLKAWTIYAEIYVEALWVDSQYRKRGLGSRLLLELEKQFEGKGYWNINLCTSEFQAPEFYQKCGFELEFVRKNSRNPRLTKYFFVKYFKNKVQTQGLLSAKK